MRKKHVNFLSMCLAVSKFYLKYETEIKSNPVLSRLFDEFFALFGVINSAVQSQAGYTSEATLLKQKEEDEMIEAVVRNASKGYVYADENKLPGLKEKFDVTAWNLRQMSDINLHVKCLTIYEAIKGISPEAIVNYGIEANDVVMLKKEIDDFYAFISQPRANIITRSQATATIEEKVKELKILFKERLDKMMQGQAQGLATMKNEYFAARMIIQRGSNTTDGDETDETPQS